ncbi:MAG: hypothetical protein KAR13_07410 [Desulfobulbaceae bacterium]|nr:hypothetical protein [Desulfobulbaceae bacterium]MCK5545340.1 hypothetical protein [Desulfobulbaceae bacterium]
MKIAESHIIMQNDHSLREQHIREESLRAWVGDIRPDFQDENPVDRGDLNSDRVTLSAEAIRERFSVTKKSESITYSTDETIGEDPRVRTIRLILEGLTGKKINITKVDEFKAETPDEPVPHGDAAINEQERVGWGMEYDYFEQHSEHEEMNFTSQGTIVTQDGHHVNFSLELSLQREFIETNSISIRAGDALLVDPLVINFDGTAAQLTDTKFAFDLNSDGEDEQISFLKPGSGFLFLDRDNNGKATDGAELFGPRTNHGFQELAQYDLDQNGWIDENDPIYEKLLIWSRNKAGDDYFSSLSHKNIGAICLEHQDTEFSLKGQANNLHGKIQNTGIFLSGDYKAGTIQEIHLTV